MRMQYAFACLTRQAQDAGLYLGGLVWELKNKKRRKGAPLKRVAWHFWGTQEGLSFTESQQNT
jgi:hypothetical protein